MKDAKETEYVTMSLEDAALVEKYKVDEAYRYLHKNDGGPYFYMAKIYHIVDGDTVDVELDLGFNIHTSMRLRVRGVDAPHHQVKDLKERERGLKSKEMMRHLNDVFGPKAFVTSIGCGKPFRGRVLADLWFQVDEKHWINTSQVMVAEGLAVPYLGEES
ncbi:hypothetical protein CMI37_18325 [Candidatus Pacearchaeota archaeon]|nr:hypothetical protein [Candidatus Pacearchaeota archaeon]